MDRLVPVFDLDGTLLDSDDALVAPFLALGVAREDITFGHTLAHECDRLGLEVQDYLDHYDPTAAEPFAGAHELLAGLERWAVCSNKHASSGVAELARLGWEPEVALFADAFGGAGKSLAPVLDHLGLDAAQVVYVGDTDHDRRCAAAVGCRFVWAGWNPRARPVPGDEVLRRPGDLVGVLAP
ncbi:MAG: HAD family hydrolase [Acidimicrobiales bacterium]|nr:HAD family hydrolase [Acidimicrobiales bacterium]MCB9372649.1 HAD family hydrolase [Microthrixaceae bacterium]